MDFIAKTFDELTTAELYEILRLRAEIFVVEQNCVYQDLDGVDYRALHILCEDGGRVIAYGRIFPDGSDQGIAHLGRVVNNKHGTGMGRKLMDACLRTARGKGYKKAVAEAQQYAIGFYKKFGFQVVSETYILDNIPHVKMELIL